MIHQDTNQSQDNRGESPEAIRMTRPKVVEENVVVCGKKVRVTKLELSGSEILKKFVKKDFFTSEQLCRIALTDLSPKNDEDIAIAKKFIAHSFSVAKDGIDINLRMAELEVGRSGMLVHEATNRELMRYVNKYPDSNLANGLRSCPEFIYQNGDTLIQRHFSGEKKLHAMWRTALRANLNSVVIEKLLGVAKNGRAIAKKSIRTEVGKLRDLDDRSLRELCLAFMSSKSKSDSFANYSKLIVDNIDVVSKKVLSKLAPWAERPENIKHPFAKAVLGRIKREEKQRVSDEIAIEKKEAKDREKATRAALSIRRERSSRNGHTKKKVAPSAVSSIPKDEKRKFLLEYPNDPRAVRLAERSDFFKTQADVTSIALGFYTKDFLHSKAAMRLVTNPSFCRLARDNKAFEFAFKHFQETQDPQGLKFIRLWNRQLENRIKSQDLNGAGVDVLSGEGPEKTVIDPKTFADHVVVNHDLLVELGLRSESPRSRSKVSNFDIHNLDKLKSKITDDNIDRVVDFSTDPSASEAGLIVALGIVIGEIYEGKDFSEPLPDKLLKWCVMCEGHDFAAGLTHSDQVEEQIVQNKAKIIAELNQGRDRKYVSPYQKRVDDKEDLGVEAEIAHEAEFKKLQAKLGISKALIGESFRGAVGEDEKGPVQDILSLRLKKFFDSYDNWFEELKKKAVTFGVKKTIKSLANSNKSTRFTPDVAGALYAFVVASEKHLTDEIVTALMSHPALLNSAGKSKKVDLGPRSSILALALQNPESPISKAIMYNPHALTVESATRLYRDHDELISLQSTVGRAFAARIKDFNEAEWMQILSEE